MTLPPLPERSTHVLEEELARLSKSVTQTKEYQTRIPPADRWVPVLDALLSAQEEISAELRKRS